MKTSVLGSLGAFVALFAFQLYWTYVTQRYMDGEAKMERDCGETNPYDWVLSWYLWANYASLVSSLLIAVLVWLAMKRS